MVVAQVIAIDNKKSKIVLEEGSVFALYRGEIRRFQIEPEKILLESDFDEIINILKKRAKERSLFLLKSSDKTEQEIRRKLLQGFYPEDVITYAVDFLKQYGYVDDFRYVENYISSHKKSQSKKIMKQKLYQKGIDQFILEEAFEALESEEESEERSMIYSLLEKKKYTYDKTDVKQKNRIMGFLARRGFEMDDIFFCMKYPKEEN